jgi:hypothetical protein
MWASKFVLHVLVQFAIFGDELIVQVNFPLHIFSMHHNNYAVKCILFQGCLEQSAGRTLPV